MYNITRLFIYPVKSLGGFKVAAAQLTDRGFKFDRRFMLIDSSNTFLTQREHPVMSLLQTAIEGDELVIFNKYAPADKMMVPLQPPIAATVTVKIWDDECKAQFVSNKADDWLSNKLAMPCRLVYMPDTEKRLVDNRYAQNKEITSFSDGYPLLIIGQASLDDLNNRLAEALPMNRFRPNIVFTGGTAYDEDIMAHIKINGVDMFGVKLCARCVMTTINQANAAKAKEPLKTLANYRMKNNKIYFGQNILFGQTGEIKTGDTIEIIKTGPVPAFNM
jgi:uncharacterized protein